MKPHRCNPSLPCALCKRDTHLIPGRSNVRRPVPTVPRRGPCLHLGKRTEFRPGCGGNLCRHECEAGEPVAIPGTVCQTCPKWESDSPEPIAPPLPARSFVTTARLAADAETLARSLPPDVDGVVGCARSGLIPAAIVASYLHLPLWSVSRHTGVVWVGGGGRVDTPTEPAPRRVAVVDDTAVLGREMHRAVEAVRAKWPGVTVTRAVVYASPDARKAVDVAHAEYPGRHWLAWNWANAGHAMSAALDFDGILCEDVPHEVDTDDERYAAFLRDARPLYLPRRRPVPLIVTARHERYRAVTEGWLSRWGVTVGRLVMRDFDRPSGVGWVLAIAAFKARHYADSQEPLFVESDPAQAVEIHRLTRRPVLCPAAGRVFA